MTVTYCLVAASLVTGRKKARGRGGVLAVERENKRSKERNKDKALIVETIVIEI